MISQDMLYDIFSVWRVQMLPKKLLPMMLKLKSMIRIRRR